MERLPHRLLRQLPLVIVQFDIAQKISRASDQPVFQTKLDNFTAHVDGIHLGTENERAFPVGPGTLILLDTAVDPAGYLLLPLYQLCSGSNFLLGGDPRSPAHLDSRRGVEPERTSSARRLGIPKADADIFTLLVDPDEKCLLVDRCNSPRSAAHHPGLRSHPILVSRIA